MEAPDADASGSVHREAHGLVADAIIPVAEGVRHRVLLMRVVDKEPGTTSYPAPVGGRNWPTDGAHGADERRSTASS